MTAAFDRALALAARGATHPNPSVGAVVVTPEGSTIGEGVTDLWPGTTHAEVRAIAATEDTRGATLVVTLEPCNHRGRTGPCTEAIIEAGITNVIVGAEDPDPRVAGSGIARLRAAGISVSLAERSDEVEALDPAYFHHRRTGRTYVVLKSALTLDGQTAARDGTSQWITSEQARQDAHALRSMSDAVMVGAGTVIADNPRLTVRHPDSSDAPQPRAVVVAGARDLPTDAALWERPDTLVYATRPLPIGAEVVVMPGTNTQDWPDIGAVASDLGSRSIVSTLVEGGAGLTRSLWEANLVNEGVFYLGARIAGGSGEPVIGGSWETFTSSVNVEVTDVSRVGPDVRVRWRPIQE